MFGDGAGAQLAAGRADAVAELCNLDRRPVYFRHPSDDAFNDRRFADVARVTANHHHLHSRLQLAALRTQQALTSFNRHSSKEYNTRSPVSAVGPYTDGCGTSSNR